MIFLLDEGVNFKILSVILASVKIIPGVDALKNIKIIDNIYDYY